MKKQHLLKIISVLILGTLLLSSVTLTTFAIPLRSLTNNQATNDSTNVYYQINYTSTYSYYRVYIDTDQSTATGYQTIGIGANYLLENGSLYSYSGNGTNWSWSFVKNVTYSNSSGTANWTVARSDIGETANPNYADLIFQLESPMTSSSKYTHTYSSTGSWVSQTYDASKPPADNPLKGLAGYIKDTAPYVYGDNPSNFPLSMEWAYIPYSSLHTGYDSYTWTGLDDRLAASSGRGHQLVFRVYIDTPDMPYAMPSWLDSSVSKTSYTDYENGTTYTSYIPDYDDEDLLSAIERFTTALATRYDGDARIGGIMIGMVGFWGEWHNWQPICECDTHMPTATNIDRILTAWDAAFSSTKLMVRYPMGTAPSNRHIGYHDDSFAYETISGESWMFTGRLTDAGESNKWQTEMIGGEVRPEIQSCVFDATTCAPSGQDWNASVDATHASWMVDNWVFNNTLSSTAFANATAGAKRLGYEFYVSSVQITDGSNLAVNIKMQNKGKAPFYYPWTVQLGIWNGSSVSATYNTSWNITTVPATATDVEFNYSNASHGLANGTYTVLMRVVNPMSGGKNLVFANQNWAQTTSGWLTLGTVTIANTPTATPTKTNTPTPTKTNTPIPPTATPTNVPNLLVDNFDGSPAWSASTTNDLSRWSGANSFVNGGGIGVESGGVLALQYNDDGWFGSTINQNISGYTYLVFVIKGAAGGEQNAFHLTLGGVDKTFAEFSGDTITTSYKTIRINMSTNGVNRASPGQLELSFWYGSSGTITIDEIRFE